MSEHYYDWETHWAKYSVSASHNPAQQMRHRIVSQFLASHAGADAKVFDIGSGHGDLVRNLVPLLPSAQLLGAELSETGVVISRRKVPHATFLVADLFQPSAALMEFTSWATYAVCSEVLEHVDDPVAFLRQARSYLCLLYTSPSPRD